MTREPGQRVTRGKSGSWSSPDGYVLAKGTKTRGGEKAGEVVLLVTCGECRAKVGEVRRVPWGSDRGRFGEILDGEATSFEVVANGPITEEMRRAVGEVRRSAARRRAAPPQPRSYWSRLLPSCWYAFVCRQHGERRLDGQDILVAAKLKQRTIPARSAVL